MKDPNEAKKLSLFYQPRALRLSDRNEDDYVAKQDVDLDCVLISHIYAMLRIDPRHESFPRQIPEHWGVDKTLAQEVNDFIKNNEGVNYIHDVIPIQGIIKNAPDDDSCAYRSLPTPALKHLHKNSGDDIFVVQSRIPNNKFDEIREIVESNGYHWELSDCVPDTTVVFWVIFNSFLVDAISLTNRRINLKSMFPHNKWGLWECVPESLRQALANLSESSISSFDIKTITLENLFPYSVIAEGERENDKQVYSLDQTLAIVRTNAGGQYESQRTEDRLTSLCHLIFNGAESKYYFSKTVDIHVRANVRMDNHGINEGDKRRNEGDKRRNEQYYDVTTLIIPAEVLEKTKPGYAAPTIGQPHAKGESMQLFHEVTPEHFNCVTANLVNLLRCLSHPYSDIRLHTIKSLKDAENALRNRGYSIVPYPQNLTQQNLIGAVKKVALPTLASILLKTNLSRQKVAHIIGICPVISEANGRYEVQYWIVDGAVDGKRALPLDEYNLNWICGVDGFEIANLAFAFIPGKRLTKRILANSETYELSNNMGMYPTCLDHKLVPPSLEKYNLFNKPLEYYQKIARDLHNEYASK